MATVNEYVHISLNEYDRFKKLEKQLEEAESAAKEGKNLVHAHNGWGGYHKIWLSDKQMAAKIEKEDKFLGEVVHERDKLKSKIHDYRRLSKYERFFKKL